jgi:hypothetical protein
MRTPNQQWVCAKCGRKTPAFMSEYNDGWIRDGANYFGKGLPNAHGLKLCHDCKPEWIDESEDPGHVEWTKEND